MQVGEYSHLDSAHQVTNCVHSHTESKKERTGGSAPASAASQMTAAAGQTEAQMTPVEWLQNLLAKGRDLALRIWEDGDGASEGTKSSVSNANGTNGSVFNSNGTDGASAEKSVIMQQSAAPQSKTEQQKRIEQMSPYFVMPDKKEASQGIFQRIRWKVHTVTGYLEKHLPFAQTGSFQAKQQQNKEDLRKRSHYRKDELEIECILTDDSYLLDSYDRKGEYSKLTTGGRKRDDRGNDASGRGAGYEYEKEC